MNENNEQGNVNVGNETQSQDPAVTGQFPSARVNSSLGNVARGLGGFAVGTTEGFKQGIKATAQGDHNPTKGLATGVGKKLNSNLMNGQKKPNKNIGKKGGPGDKKNDKNDKNDKNNGQNNKEKNNQNKNNGQNNKGNNQNNNKRNQNNNKDAETKKKLGSKLNPFNRVGQGIKSKLGLGSKDSDKKEKSSGKQLITTKAKQLFAALPVTVKVQIIVVVGSLLLIGIIAFIILAAIFGGVSAGVIASMCDNTEYADVTGTNEDAIQFMCNMSDPLGGNSKITSLFGWRNYNLGHMHKGNDLVGQSAILAAGSGKVIHAGLYGGYGYAVIIDHGGGIKTLYAHMSSLKVSKGQTVKTGDQVGVMGGTGVNGAVQYAVHLHFEIRVGDANNGYGTPTSANPYFGYSDKGYEKCIKDGTPVRDCGINDTAKSAARKLGDEAFEQVCGKTKNYNTPSTTSSSDSSDSCCETDNQGNGDSKNIRDFINKFEGSGGYCDSSKTQYKAYQNAGDRVTIGHGVTSDYLPNLKSAGQCFSVSEVDAAEDRAIEAKRNGVIKPKFIGVNLEKYQEDALTSMAFNGCGTYFTGIANAAKEGNLEKVWNAMKGCTNGGMLGLQRRRKAEFALYVTGDYNVVDEYIKKTWTSSQYDNYDSDGVLAKKASGTSSTCTTSSSGGSIADRANQEYEKWNQATPSERSELIKNYMSACGNGRTCNDWCAGFVSYILKETGKLDKVKGYTCMADSYKDVSPAEHHKQGSGYTPQPGDVIVFSGHVALVEKVEGKTVHYIGGNQTGKNTATCWGNAVTKNTVAVDSGKIHEYVTIG